jgi:hypothetical protein
VGGGHASTLQAASRNGTEAEIAPVSQDSVNYPAGCQHAAFVRRGGYARNPPAKCLRLDGIHRWHVPGAKSAARHAITASVALPLVTCGQGNRIGGCHPGQARPVAPGLARAWTFDLYPRPAKFFSISSISGSVSPALHNSAKSSTTTASQVFSPCTFISPRYRR